MKNLCKITASVLIFVFSFSYLCFAAENEKVFTDIDEGTSVGKAIMKMYDKGYIAGYGDKTFRPNANITRAELVRIVNQVLGYELQENAVNKFTDVTEKDWFYEDVLTSLDNGYITGFPDGSFRPRENFTRQQMCVILVQIFDFVELPYDKMPADFVSPWAEEYVKTILSNRVMSLEEGNKFRAADNITRAEVCQTLAPFIVEKPTEDGVNHINLDKDNSTGSSGSSSSGGSSSGGGGGGGGGGSSAATETTTTAEQATETTTKSSSNNNNTQTTTESATETTTSSQKEEDTEVTTEDPAVRQQVIGRIGNVISAINDFVIPECSSQSQIDVCNIIISKMRSYTNNANFDIYAEKDEILALYNTLSGDEKSELKMLISSYNQMEDLLVLKDYFLPDM